MSPATICIRKYPNRRLYDTSRSAFITSLQLHQLVQAGNRIQVIETATGQDITNIVLVQSIIEREPSRIQSMPTEVFHNMLQGAAAAGNGKNDQVMSKLMASFAQWAGGKSSHNCCSGTSQSGCSSHSANAAC